MAKRQPEKVSGHRVFEPDAPQSARVLFEAACDRLDFDMERAMCKDDVRYMLNARGSEKDQALIRKLRQRFGLTKNALMLTAIRLGLEVLSGEGK